MRLTVPGGTASSPRTRFLALEPANREIVIAASVVGSTFSISQVSRITEQRESDVLEALQRAFELGLVSDTGDPNLVSFESEAYETIRKLVLTPRVRALQSRIAQDMEQRLGDPAETAERWLAAGEKAKACAAYERAGDRCFAAGDDREAQRLFRSALNESAEDAEKSRLRGKIADAAVRAGRPVDAVLVARAQLVSLENRLVQKLRLSESATPSSPSAHYCSDAAPLAAVRSARSRAASRPRATSVTRSSPNWPKIDDGRSYSMHDPPPAGS